MRSATLCCVWCVAGDASSLHSLQGLAALANVAGGPGTHPLIIPQVPIYSFKNLVYFNAGACTADGDVQ